MASKKSTAVILPNLGLYLDRKPLAMHPRMLQDGLNFRVKEGVLSNLNLGWAPFLNVTLNGPITFIADFTITGGSEQIVIGTYKDIYKYIDANTVSFLTPRYETGTVSRSGNIVTGVGTTFTTNVSIGDQIYFGATGKTDPTASWDTITAVTDNTHLTTTGSGTVGSGNYTIRKLFQGNISNIWQYDVFVNASPSAVNELWMTNGLDSIVRWNGSDTQVQEMSATIGFTAKTLRVYDDMMLFFNVNQGGTNLPTDMLNSDTGKPQNVGSASTGVSNQFKVHPGTSEILRAEPLGNNLVIYSSNNRITLTQFVGSPLFFIFQQVSITLGIIAANAVVNFGNYHEFIAPTTQYYFDGATAKPINGHVWREILRQQDPSRLQISFGFFDQQNADLIWAIPLTTDTNLSGSASTAYVEHYLEQPGGQNPTPYSKRSFPFTAFGTFKRNVGLTWNQISTQWKNTSFRWNDRFFASGFPLILVGDFTGHVWQLNTVQDANGVALNSYVTFGRRALFDGRNRGIVSRVYPFITQLTTPLQVTVQMSDSGQGNPMIIDTKTFDQTQPEGQHSTSHYRAGRFIEVKFGSTGPNQPWEIGGYDIDVKPGGTR